MKEVVIVSAVRTPIGKFKGDFSRVSAVDLGVIAVKESLQRANLSPDRIAQVILGNVFQAGSGQNPARQVAILAGIPVSAPAMTVNEVCGSGLKAVILGKQAIQLGRAQAVVVGGIENMSQTPLLLPREQSNSSEGMLKPVDSMVRDGLTDAFSQEHMGITAEAVASKYQVSRLAQDQYALDSQLKAAKAQAAGHFSKEIVPVQLPSGEIISHDQSIRGNSTLEKLSALPTVFKKDGTVTAGTSSPINDGASALVLMDKTLADQEGIEYLATLDEYTEIGSDPHYMGYAPFYAINDLLTNLELAADEIDLYEINEAFASQSVAISRDLRLPVDRVNTCGGAIALGHPLGASGARILTTLVHSLVRDDKKIGIASLCVGGGIGLALAVSR